MTPAEIKAYQDDFIKRREEAMNPTDRYSQLYNIPPEKWSEADIILYFTEGIKRWLEEIGKVLEPVKKHKWAPFAKKQEVANHRLRISGVLSMDGFSPVEDGIASVSKQMNKPTTDEKSLDRN